MRALWMLIQIQIKNKKASYASIFILTLLIGFMLSTSLSLVVNIRSAAEEAIGASNFGDLYLNFFHNYVPTRDDINRLNRMEEINRVRALKKIKVNGEPAHLLHVNGEKSEIAQGPAIYTYNKDQLPLRLLSLDKRSYVPADRTMPPEKGHVYLPIAFMAMYDAELGDTYLIETEEDRFAYKVSGFVEDITQINMVSIGEHNVYVNREDFRDLEKKSEEEKAAVISLLDGVDACRKSLDTLGLDFNDLKGLSENTDLANGQGSLPDPSTLKDLEELQGLVDLDTVDDRAELEKFLSNYLQEYRFNYVLHLDIADGYMDEDTDVLFQKIEDETGLRNQSFLYGDDEMFVYFASLVSYIVLLVIVIFVMILFIAGLAILNFNIYSSIESEYTNIGVMKAVGLKGRTFNLIYLSTYPAVIFLGLAMGTLLAIPALKVSGPIVLDLTGILGRTGLAWGPIGGVFLLLLGVCLVLIVWQLRRINKIKPHRVLREGKQAVYGTSGMKVKLAKPFFQMRLSFKQFTASAGTYFVSIFVIAILFFFVLIGFSMTTLMTPDRMMEEYWGFDWDIMVFYPNQKDYENLHKEVDKIVSEEAEIKDAYLVYNHMVNGLDQNIVTFTLPEQYTDRMTSLSEGRPPETADELALTKTLADSRGIKIGDDIELSYQEKKATYRVTGFFQTTNNIGRSVTLTAPALERLLGDSYDDEMPQVWYILEDQSLSDRVKEKINAAYPDLVTRSIVETLETYGLMSGAFDLLPLIILVFTLVFVLMSSFLLAEKIFNREQMDFGIMKAIGFRNGMTRHIFSFRFSVVAFIGLFLGSLIFYLAANPLLNQVGSLMGLSKLTIRVPMLQVLISALTMIVLFWFIAYIISRKIERLKVRDLVADN